MYVAGFLGVRGGLVELQGGSVACVVTLSMMSRKHHWDRIGIVGCSHREMGTMKWSRVMNYI